MNLKNLGFRDFTRLASVCMDIVDGVDGPSVEEIARAIRDSVRLPGDGDGNVTHVHPSVVIDPKMVDIVAKARALVVKRYGEAYAIDLWERLTG